MDNLHIAKAIALECGILRADQDLNEVVIEGQEFRSLTTIEFTQGVEEQTNPEVNKQELEQIRQVALSQQMEMLKGQVVTVTGNGTNDAPALKELDIGLSMGIQGTKVAKESSDIFCNGEGVYNNIQKFIQFQLTVNVAALVINFIVIISSGDVPLTKVRLLRVNLIMDTLGALALATERPAGELMDQKPVGRTASLITNVMWRNLTAQALYQVSILLTMQFKGESIFGVTRKVRDTMIFNSFVICQVFNEFNVGKQEKKNVFEGIHRNRLFVGIVASTVVLQVVMVEFLKRFADTEKLN
ncbi:putative calcium-transporting ATPase 13, plasma membrane-type [Asimina triloba]